MLSCGARRLFWRAPLHEAFQPLQALVAHAGLQNRLPLRLPWQSNTALPVAHSKQAEYPPPPTLAKFLEPIRSHALNAECLDRERKPSKRDFPALLLPTVLRSAAPLSIF